MRVLVFLATCLLTAVVARLAVSQEAEGQFKRFGETEVRQRGATPLSEKPIAAASHLRWAPEPKLRPNLLNRRVQPIDPQAFRPRQRLAVCIGVNGYPESSSYGRLQYAGADAIAMADAFLNSAHFDNVLLMTDAAPEANLQEAVADGRLQIVSDVTHLSIYKEVRQFLKLAAGFDDILVFYFAGHGNSGNTAYLVPADDDPLPLSWVFEWMIADTVRARNKLIVLDACRSSPGDARGNTMSLAFREALVQPGQRITVLTGCDADQSCFEGDTEQQGRFTWAMLDALRGSGFKPGEEHLLVSHLYEHVLLRFHERAWDEQQSPQQFVAGPVFSLAYREVPKPPPLDKYEWEDLKRDLAEARQWYQATHQAGHLERAASKYRYCLRVTSSTPLEGEETRRLHGRLLLEKARVHYRLGEREQVEPLLKDAAQYLPGAPVLLELDAYRLADVGDQEAALNKLSAAIGSVEDSSQIDAYLWSRKAVLEEAIGDYASAAQSYGQAAVGSHRSGDQLKAERFFEQMEFATSRAWLDQSRLSGDVSRGLEAAAAELACAQQVFGQDHWRSRTEQYYLDYMQREARLGWPFTLQFMELETLYNRAYSSGRYGDAYSLASYMSDLERDLLGSQHPNYAASLINGGDCLQALGRHEEAIRVYTAALEILRETYGDEHRETALCVDRLGGTVEDQGRPREALTYYRKALEGFEQCADAENAAAACIGVARVSRGLGETAGAEDAVRRALELLSGREGVNAAWLQGRLLYEDGQYAAAIPHFQTAIPLYDASGLPADAAWMYHWIGSCYRDSGDHESAAQSYRESLARFERLGHVEGIADNSSLVGQALYELGQFPQAVPHFLTAARAYEAFGLHVDMAWMHHWIGDCHRAHDDLQSAQASYEEAINHFQTLGDSEGIAQALYKLDRFQDAVPHFELAAETYEARGELVSAAWMHNWIGDCHRESGDSPSAVTSYQEAHRRFAESHDDGGIAENDTELAQLLFQLARYDEAIPYFRSAAAAYASTGRAIDAAWMDGWEGDCHRGLSRREETIAAYRKCVTQFEQLQHPEGISINARDLANELYLDGSYDEAIATFEKAEAAYQQMEFTSDAASMRFRIALCYWDSGREAEGDSALEVLRESVLAGIDVESSASALLDAGIAAMDAGQHGRAVPLLSEAEQLYRKAGNRDQENEALFWHGRCFYYLSQPEQSLAMLEKVLERFVASQHALGIANSTSGIAQALFALERYSEAIPKFQDAASAYQAIELAVDEAWMHSWIGDCHQNLGQHQEAEESYRTALRQFEQLDHDSGVAQNTWQLGYTLYQLSQYEQALGHFQSAAAVYDRLDQASDAAWMFRWIGDCRAGLDDDESAVAGYAEAVRRFQEIDHDEGLGDNSKNLGQTLFRLTRYQEAVGHLQTAVERYDRLGRETDAAWIFDWIGACHRDSGDDEAAVASYAEAVRRFQEIDHDEGLADNSKYLGQALFRLTRYQEAVEHFQGAAERYGRLGREIDAAWMFDWMGACHRDSGDDESAAASYAEAVRRFEQLEFDVGLATDSKHLAGALYRLARGEEAAVHFQTAVQTFERLNQPAELAALYGWLGDLHWGRDDYAAAEDGYREALRRFEELADDTGFAETAWELGRTLFHLNRFEEAASRFQSAAAAYDRLGHEISAGWMHDWLADCYTSLERHDEAVDGYREALRRFQKLEFFSGAAENGWQLGRVLYYLRRYDEAVVELERAGRAYETLDQPAEAAFMFGWIGDCHSAANKNDAAVEAYAECARRMELLEHDHGFAVNAGRLAQSLSRLQRYQEAAGHFERAAAAYQKLSFPAEVASMQLGCGVSYARLRRFDQARLRFNQAVEGLRQAEQWRSLAQTAVQASDVLAEEGRRDDAIHYLGVAEEAYSTLQDEQELAQLRQKRKQLRQGSSR